MEEVDKELDSWSTGGIEEAWDLLEEFADHDLLHINCCHLEANECEAIKNDYGKDTMLKEKSPASSPAPPRDLGHRA